jgi:hypothetical protein
MLDLAQDTIIIFGWTWQASTLIIWLSAMAGFIANIIVNRRAYYDAFKEKRLREIASEAFNKAEKIAAITPISGDDKLLEFIKYSIKAFHTAFKRKPSAAEIAYLKDKAAAMAEEDKLKRIKAAPVPVISEFTSIAPVSECLIIESKPAPKKAAPKKAAPKKPAVKKSSLKKK